MNIVAPISRLTEIGAIAEAGANELYCGVVPRDWVGTFKAANTNRRPGGNLSSLDELAQAVELAHSHQCTLSLVLNAQAYSAERSSAATDIAKNFLEMGGDALIVSDIGLIHALARQLPEARIHVSSVATCRNASGARLYRELGARRIILPRDVTIDEAIEIAAEVPDIELEAFVLNDGCVFEEGACNTIHLPGKLGGPICLDSYVYAYRHRNGRPVSERLRDKLVRNDIEYRKWLWYRFSCGFTTTPDGMPYGPCGLCAIPAFLRGKIAAVKIAGREGPTRRKVASVQLAKRILDASASGADDNAVYAIAKNLRPSVEHCATGYMCYYPEVVDYPSLPVTKPR